MAQLTEELAPSELFGHKKGAFTEAFEDKEGAFLFANGGTLVLDEITEVSISVQAMLLRTIENKRIRRVGCIDEEEVDVRVIATSNREIQNAIRGGKCRQDLYYRLSGVHIHIPPLRGRLEDIPPLVEYFVGEVNEKYKLHVKGMRECALNLLKMHKWEGNVRELRNLVFQLAMRKREGWIGEKDLREIPPTRDLRKRRRCLSREEVDEALRASGWNKSKAARMLGIHRQQVQRLVKRYEFKNNDG